MDGGIKATARSLPMLRGLGLVGALILAACGGDDDDAGAQDYAGIDDVESDTVIHADYGGTTREAHVAASLEPFQQATGIRGVSADADSAKLKLFAEQERADWDLVDLAGWEIVRFAEDGLLAELPSGVTRSELVPEEFQDYASGGWSGSYLIGYRTDEYEEPPDSWADFFDTAAFPGKRALPTYPPGPVEAALLADGVPCDELFPLDFDRAFAKLDEIRDEILFPDTLGQGTQFLAQGSVSMVLNTNGRILLLQDEGMPVEVVWNEALLSLWDAAAIPRDAPHLDAAFAYVDFRAQPEQQAAFSRLTYYGPTNPDALELLDDETLGKLPSSDANRAIACEQDPVAFSDDLEEYTERYSEWLARG